MSASVRDSLFALETIGIKLGLDQIRALLSGLGHPDRAYPSLVIAGTNGKGSVTAVVERALRAAGYRTGRYTSPHLIDLEERVAVNGQPIARDLMDILIARVMGAAARLETPPTFFEATTALALEAFRSAAVEVAVLEVGLGGRLDATNAVQSRAVAITSVDFDHQTYLGHTIEEIAREKAGVIKPGGLTVLGENSAPVCRVVLDVAAALGANLVYAPDGTAADTRMVEGRMVASIRTPRTLYADLKLALRGRHQVTNAITAIRLLEELHFSGMLEVPAGAIRIGIEEAVWPARLELIQSGEKHVLIDGAHNPAGARALASYVMEAYDRRLPFVVGVMRDKQIDEIIAAIVPVASHFVCTAARSARAVSAEELAAVVTRLAPDRSCVTAGSAGHALELAASLGSPVVVAGSLYLAGEVRAELS